LASDGSVFFREHHYEDARRDSRIGGIRRHQLHVGVVVVDFPDAADIAVLDKAEVVLAMRVVVFVEVIERANPGENRMTPVGGKRFKAGSDYYRPACKRAAERVIERADAARASAFSGSSSTSRGLRNGSARTRAPVVDPRSRISRRSCSTRLLLL
jgi:hypothetical protein